MVHAVKHGQQRWTNRWHSKYGISVYEDTGKVPLVDFMRKTVSIRALKGMWNHLHSGTTWVASWMDYSGPWHRVNFELWPHHQKDNANRIYSRLSELNSAAIGFHRETFHSMAVVMWLFARYYVLGKTATLLVNDEQTDNDKAQNQGQC
jgi:hypothetical protein